MKTLIDPIHGAVIYPDYIFKIVDTEEFQRLRNLKQLGYSSNVFPGASHTRFDHCLGVCHLSNVLMNNLEKNSDGLKISEFHRKCVTVSALLHDIGHGPLSHLWERFVYMASGTKCNHELVSCNIVESIFRNYKIPLFNDVVEQTKGVKLITLLISGNDKELLKILGPELGFLSEIVHNSFCEIDVDKYDYILRDSYYLNNVIKVDKSCVNFFAGARVTLGLDNIKHISYNVKDYNLIYTLFKSRSDLHKICYKNQIVAGLEQQICDIFLHAELDGFRIKNIKMSEAHLNLNVYKYLDDTILKIIYLSDDPKMKNVQKVIQLFNERNIYKKIYESDTESDINLLKNSLGNCFVQVVQEINIEIPKNLLLHDDVGRLTAPTDIFENEKYKKYIIFCKDTVNANEFRIKAKEILRK